jgi:UDP-2,3-diacylglucosamine pyrophosphatase LpxH
MSRDKMVVVSDLHADTWLEDEIVPHTDKAKREHFKDFLEEVVKPQAHTLVINGDIFDSPCKDGRYLLPYHSALLAQLLKFLKDTRVYYFVGNHDLGLFGLSVNNFDNLTVVYPSGQATALEDKCIEVDPSRPDGPRVYFDHGHIYDPFLGKYIFDLMRVTKPPGAVRASLKQIKPMFLSLIGRHDQAQLARTKQHEKDQAQAHALNMRSFQVNQRRDPGTGARRLPPGLVTANNGSVKDRWKKEAVGFGWPIAEDRVINKFYPQAARRVFDQICGDRPDWPVAAGVFGHTHIPWAEELVYEREASRQTAWYLNSGDWSEPTKGWKDLRRHHASFIVLGPDGRPVPAPTGKRRYRNTELVRDWILENYEPPPAVAEG